MAETEGFEPSVEFDPHTGLAIQHHRPLGHVSLFITLWLFVNLTLYLLLHLFLHPSNDRRKNSFINEGYREKVAVGFEPTLVLPKTVFKTVALNHSATPPQVSYILFSRKRQILFTPFMACLLYSYWKHRIQFCIVLTYLL